MSSKLPSQTEPSVSQQCGNGLAIMQAFRDRLAARQELLPDLADQLRSALQQTEQAVLEISGNFMNIAGRARKQLQAAADIVGSSVQERQTAPGSDAGKTAKAEKLAAKLEGLSEETDILGKDINGIIIALQFQDITRQQIEKVIVRLAQFQEELNDMKRSLDPGSASAPGPDGAYVCRAEVNRGEHV